MIESISTKQIDQILSSNYHLKVKIEKNYNYFLFQNQHFDSIISACNKQKIVTRDLVYKNNIVSYGVPLILIEKQNHILIPTLLDFVTLKECIQIRKTQIDLVSRGLSIKIDAKNGSTLLLDGYKRKIALGNVISKKFKPVVDIGWYLRAEN